MVFQRKTDPSRSTVSPFAVRIFAAYGYQLGQAVTSISVGHSDSAVAVVRNSLCVTTGADCGSNSGGHLDGCDMDAFCRTRPCVARVVFGAFAGSHRLEDELRGQLLTLLVTGASCRRTRR